MARGKAVTKNPLGAKLYELCSSGCEAADLPSALDASYEEVSALIGHIRAHSALYGFTIAPIKKGPQCNDTIVSAVLVGRDAEAYANPVIRHGSRIGHLSHLRSEITAAQRRRETFEAMANGMKQSAAKREIELMCRNARRIEEDQLSIIDMLSGELAA